MGLIDTASTISYHFYGGIVAESVVVWNLFCKGSKVDKDQ